MPKVRFLTVFARSKKIFLHVLGFIVYKDQTFLLNSDVIKIAKNYADRVHGKCAVSSLLIFVTKRGHLQAINIQILTLKIYFESF